MNFQSLSFLLFLVVTVTVCLAAGRKNRTAGLWLLLISCGVFYLSAFDRLALGGFGVLLGGALVTRAAITAPKPARGLYLTAACWHIGILLWYKCAGFFAPELYHGWMPLGLSFFTVELLSLLKLKLLLLHALLPAFLLLLFLQLKCQYAGLQFLAAYSSKQEADNDTDYKAQDSYQNLKHNIHRRFRRIKHHQHNIQRYSKCKHH